jgi:regulator of sirC expression with transglutaminase-like and TPR domain
MAEMAQESLRSEDSPIETVGKINTLLFETLGFRGNTGDYYDPRNSFFNDVLDRRVGIPITLSTVYLEVTRRLKFPIVGVGMPGHFIVKFADRYDEFFLDPFERGKILTREDCQRKLHEMYGDSLEFHERLLGRVTNRQILSRMLNNLKLIYLKAQAFDKGLAIVDMMLMTNPDDCEQFRDRGLLRLQLRQFEAATKDLNQYLTSCPAAHDREEIENHLKELKRIQAMMN